MSIRIRVTHHKATHHKATHHHKKKAATHHHKTATHHHKKKASTTASSKTTSSAKSSSSGSVDAASVVSAILQDTAATSRLTDAVASTLFSGGFAAEIIQAIEAVVSSGQTRGPGRRMAGRVSTLTGALQGGGPSGSLPKAMVFLHGSATAVPCYVPPHLIADIAAHSGQGVWVEPVNGNDADLMIVAVRNFTATPAARIEFFATTPVIWNSQAITNGVVQAVTAAGNYGVPANATGVLLFSYAWTGAPSTIGFGPGATGGQYHWWLGTSQGQGWVPLDSSGAFHINPGGSGNLTLYLAGYCL